MAFLKIKKIINETKFSPRAQKLITQALRKSWKRGQLTPDDEKKLKEIIDADIFLDKVELEARKDLKSIF